MSDSSQAATKPAAPASTPATPAATTKSEVGKFVISTNHALYRLKGVPAEAEAGEFETEMTKLMANAVHVVIDCEGLRDLPQSWIRAILKAQRDLRGFEKTLKLASVPDHVMGIIRTAGLETSLKMAPTVKDALKDLAPPAPKKLDVNFINPFLDATISVLEVQTQTKAKAGTPHLKKEEEKLMGDISGVIGLVADAFTGTVVISFPEATFLKLISRMLGEEFTSITPEIKDGAGELTNIIFGQAKIDLNKKGYGIKTALPSVVTGKDHTVSDFSKGPKIIIPFECDVGSFAVEIILSN